MGIMDRLNNKFPNGILNIGGRNTDVVGYLQSKIEIDIAEQTEDMNRIFNFRNYVESLEDALEEDSGYKVEYYSASILGVEAVAFIDVDEYDKHRDNSLPSYVVSPLFVYAPDIDRMLYKRSSSELGIEKLLNFTIPIRVSGYTKSDDERENEEKEDIKISYTNFKTVILPIIRESMTEDEAQAKVLERRKAIEMESTKVKEYVSNAQNLDEAYEKLLLKEIEYHTKSREIAEDISAYNENVALFDTKLKDLEVGLTYLEEKKQELIALNSEVEDIENKSIVDMPTILRESKLTMSEMFEKYKEEYLNSLKSEMINAKKNEHEIDKNKMKETMDNLLSDFISNHQVEEREYDDINGVHDIILEFLTIESEKIANNSMNSLNLFDSSVLQKPIKQLEAGYNYLKGNLHLDNEAYKQIIQELGEIQKETHIRIIRKDNKNRFIIFLMEVDGFVNAYFVSPILVSNATLDIAYAGFSNGEKQRTTEEYAIRTKENVSTTEKEDGKVLANIIEIVKDNFKSREEKIKEFVFKQEVTDFDETWSTKVDSFLAYLKLNLPIYQKLVDSNILVSASHDTKIPLDRSVIYSGSYIAFKTASYTIIISAKNVYYIKNDTKTLATKVKYESITELSKIIQQNKNVFGENPDKKLQLIIRLLLGLDLRGNYVKHLNKYEEENGKIALKTKKQ